MCVCVCVVVVESFNSNESDRFFHLCACSHPIFLPQDARSKNEGTKVGFLSLSLKPYFSIDSNNIRGNQPAFCWIRQGNLKEMPLPPSSLLCVCVLVMASASLCGAEKAKQMRSLGGRLPSLSPPPSTSPSPSSRLEYSFSLQFVSHPNGDVNSAYAPSQQITTILSPCQVCNLSLLLSFSLSLLLSFSPSFSLSHHSVSHVRTSLW